MSQYADLPPDAASTGSGIASINGDTTSAQTIVVGTSGTSPTVATVAGATTINLPLASTGGVTAGLISNSDQSLIGTIGGKSARTTRFISIGAGTSGTVTLPALSSVVLSDFGGTVNALVCGITSGHPDFTPVLTAGGVVVATTFDASGNYVFTGTPSSYPVAILYRVAQNLKDFDSASANIVGSVDFDNGSLHATRNLSDLASANTALNNILPSQATNNGKFLSTDGTNTSWVASSGSGTVTSASVVSANGFAGTVATATTTPAITIQTSVTGVLKGNGTALSAAVDADIPGSALDLVGSTNVRRSSGLSSFGQVGIGTSSPSDALNVLGTGVTRISIDSYGTGSSPVLNGRRSNGVIGTPTAVITDDSLLSISGKGYNGTALTTTSAVNISLHAAENWTATATGGYMRFMTVPVGTTTLTERARLAATGNLLLNTTTDDASHTLQVNGTILGTGATLSGLSPSLSVFTDASKNLTTTGVTGISQGGTNVSSVTTTPAATAFAGWDANKNFNANAYIRGFASTVTAAGTTTLTVASQMFQRFTGTTTQTLVLPDATTLLVGHSFIVGNRSTGAVTVNANGGSLVQTLSAGAQSTYTLAANGVAAGTWDFTAAAGGSGTVTSVTFTGDGTVLSATPSSAVTTSGTVTGTLNTQLANTVLAGPASGGAVAPTFRALTVADGARFTKVFNFYTSSTTMADPGPGCQSLRIRGIGGGAGGGSGAAAAASTAHSGGGAGSAGAVVDVTIPYSAVSSWPVTITIGASAAGGVGTAGTGNSGTAGNSTSFGTYVVMVGGNPGAAGITGAGTPAGGAPRFGSGISGTAPVNGINGFASGGNSGLTQSAVAAGGSGFAGSGGGGGGMTAAAGLTGGNGGSNFNGATAAAGGVNTGAVGTNGTNGDTTSPFVGFGGGGGGGAGSATAGGTAFAGGNGGLYGAGGGGGSATTTITSGAGGSGAQGFLMVIAE